MRPDQIRKAAEEFDIPVKDAVRVRTKYLQSLLGRWVAYIDEQTDVMPESDVMAIIGELVRIKRAGRKAPAGGITDEQIQQAREYPIDQLIEFVRGKIACPFHDDKHPSAYYGSRGKVLVCPVCNKTWSALDILIERDGYSFIDGVKYLSSGG